MSGIDSNSRIDYSNVDVSDLCLDLDDDDDDEDQLLFKIPDPVPVTLNTSNGESENDEDFLIRTQPMFSSTQSNPITPGIISTQSVTELILKKPTQTTIDLNSSALTAINDNDDKSQDLIDKTVWYHAQNDLNSKFISLGLDSDLLKKFTIEFYFKKFFDYNLLRMAETGLRKLPILLLWIKEINRNDRNSNATVILTDGLEQIKGTISKQITMNNWDQLSIGSVLLLQNVCLLRVNFTKNGYHLNISKPNLLRLYFKKLNKIDKIDFNELRSDNVKFLIESFEKTYVFIDSSLIKLNTSKASSRPAPYHVPTNKAKNSKEGRAQTKQQVPSMSQKEISQGTI